MPDAVLPDPPTLEMQLAAPDPVGLWYSLQETRFGEAMSIRFGRMVPGAREPEWVELPHASVDGLGGLWLLHRQIYGADGAWEMPARAGRAPSALRRSWRLLRLLAKPVPPIAAWRDFDRSWRWGARERPGIDPTSWIVVDEARTRRLVERARREEGSVGALLLWALARAVGPALDLDRGLFRWMVPVNVRGPIRRRRPWWNHSSYVRVETLPAASPRDVAGGLRAALAAEEHLTLWQGVMLGTWLGAGSIRRTLAQTYRDGAPWVGMFSNLGVVPARADTRGAGDTWLFCPPVTRAQPFTLGALTWCGRLALTARTHPSLRVGRDQVESWVRSCVAIAEGGP